MGNLRGCTLELLRLNFMRARQAERRPRLVFFTTVFQGSTIGGTTFVSYLLEANRSGTLDLRFASAAIESETDPRLLPVKTPWLLRHLPLGWLSQSFLFRRLAAKRALKSSTDIFWHNNLITALAFVLLRCKIPVVGMINDYSNLRTSSPLASRRELGAYRSVARWFWRAIEKFVARRIDHVVVNSEYLKGRVTKEYGVPAERIALLYKGVDLQRFSRVDESRAPEPARGPPRKILFLKSDFVLGGLWDLFEALCGLPAEITVTVAGPLEKARATIMGEAQRLHVADRIRWRGNTPHSEVADLLWEHDLLCVPSRAEALGVVFLEALAAGTPAVGTSIGGIPEVLDNGRAGWMAPPQNPEGLRMTLVEALENPDERCLRVQRGLVHVRKFSAERMVSEFCRISTGVVEGTP